jgi:osmotically-inducible protein OsmY
MFFLDRNMTTVAKYCDLLIDDSAADEDLCQRVKLYLAQATPLYPTQPIAVTAHNGTVTLAGDVPSYHSRQLAAACTRRVAGVRSVVDHLHVSPAAPRATLVRAHD